MKSNCKQRAEYLRQLVAMQAELYRYILTLCGRAVPVEDLRQNTNLRVVQLLGKDDEPLPSIDNFHAWTRKVAFYQVMSWRSRSKRERVLFDDALVERLAETFEERPAATRREEERSQALEDCLKRLPESLRAMVKERYQPGADVNHMAESRQTTPHAITMNLYRAKLDAQGMHREEDVGRILMNEAGIQQTDDFDEMLACLIEGLLSPQAENRLTEQLAVPGHLQRYVDMMEIEAALRCHGSLPELCLKERHVNPAWKWIVPFAVLLAAAILIFFCGYFALPRQMVTPPLSPAHESVAQTIAPQAALAEKSETAVEESSMPTAELLRKKGLALRNPVSPTPSIFPSNLLREQLRQLYSS